MNKKQVACLGITLALLGLSALLRDFPETGLIILIFICISVVAMTVCGD